MTNIPDMLHYQPAAIALTFPPIPERKKKNFAGYRNHNISLETAMCCHNVSLGDIRNIKKRHSNGRDSVQILQDGMVLVLNRQLIPNPNRYSVDAPIQRLIFYTHKNHPPSYFLNPFDLSIFSISSCAGVFTTSTSSTSTCTSTGVAAADFSADFPTDPPAVPSPTSPDISP